MQDKETRKDAGQNDSISIIPLSAFFSDLSQHLIQATGRKAWLHLSCVTLLVSWMDVMLKLSKSYNAHFTRE
jgi:hypothetical protein